MKLKFTSILLAMLAPWFIHYAEANETIVLADFEGLDYGAWVSTGNAFGSGPAQGTLARQSEVSGYLGSGLVNTYLGRDNAQGTLTSPLFEIERKYITFLIGGGGWAGETCINLLINDKVVRTATGPNASGGGSERLDFSAWDVAEFLGKKAQIQIVDQRRHQWGHINVDQIEMTNEASVPEWANESKIQPKTLTRTLLIDADFLQLPLIQPAKPKEAGLERLDLKIDGEIRRFLHVDLAAEGVTPDIIYSYDVREFRGREVTLRFKSRDAKALEKLELNNQEVIDPEAYSGPHRPQFHFSPRMGWMNDINGPYYQDGLYHMFYQANPTTTGHSSGFDMHWGHSVSKDLVHWEEWPIALFPDSSGRCFSGSAVLVKHPLPGIENPTGLPTPALLFTAAGTPRTQRLATTVDGGKTWQRFAGNPVLPELNRDPKVFWHEESQHYITLLYMNETEEAEEGFTIYRSKNMLDWEKVGHIPSWNECPEFLQLTSPSTGKKVWVLYGNWRDRPDRDLLKVNYPSAYQLGEFDGTTFKPTSEVRPAHGGPFFYGALIFQNEPKGRAIMMGWARGIRFPGEPFNQCASVPLRMQLKEIGGKDRLCFEPVEELASLRGEALINLKNVSVKEAMAELAKLDKAQPVDVLLRFRPKTDHPVRIQIRQCEFVYEPKTGKLTPNQNTVSTEKYRVIHSGKSVSARFLIDRAIIESFWNDGEAAYALRGLHTDAGPAFVLDGEVEIEQLVVYPLSNIWD